jgi:hypothetical protein
MFRLVSATFVLAIFLVPANSLAFDDGGGNSRGGWGSLTCSKVVSMDGKIFRFCQDPKSGEITIWDGDTTYHSSECAEIDLGNTTYSICIDPVNATLTATRKSAPED